MSSSGMYGSVCDVHMCVQTAKAVTAQCDAVVPMVAALTTASGSTAAATAATDTLPLLRRVAAVRALAAVYTGCTSRAQLKQHSRSAQQQSAVFLTATAAAAVAVPWSAAAASKYVCTVDSCLLL
jgi:hypothetical protein